MRIRDEPPREEHVCGNPSPPPCRRHSTTRSAARRTRRRQELDAAIATGSARETESVRVGSGSDWRRQHIATYLRLRPTRGQRDVERRGRVQAEGRSSPGRLARFPLPRSVHLAGRRVRATFSRLSAVTCHLSIASRFPRSAFRPLPDS